jgi:hypothetical protein
VAGSATGEEFGITRVSDVACTNAHSAVTTVYAKLLAAVKAWTPVQHANVLSDNVMLLVMRRPTA